MRRRSLINSVASLLIAVSVSTTGLCWADNETQTGNNEIPADAEQFHIILLVGQSNMAGRGKISEQDTKPHPRVLMLNKTLDWVPAVDPLHFDKPGIVGVGLGRTFGVDYAEAHPGVTVGLVPCAVGGSAISTWQPGGYHKQTKSHPWDDMLPRAKAALKRGRLKAILWHQGESDSNEKNASVYEQRLHELIARFRSDLDAQAVPFIAGQMGIFEERPWNDFRKQVDNAHRNLPHNVDGTAFVSAEGLRHKGDQVHFDASSYREFGHRYFQAFQKLETPTASRGR